MEEIRATLPELPWVRKARIQQEWGLSDAEMRDIVNAGALEPIIATVAAGTTSGEARSWWVSYLAQKANQQGIELDQLPITPTQVAHVVELIKAGKLTNKLARQAVDGVLAGEGDVDEAIAANPDIVAKYRAGNTKVAGAIVGQVMKATRGKADPGQVNKLIAAKLAE